VKNRFQNVPFKFNPRHYTEGSVFKKDYYRNEDDNPGAAATATMSAMAEADAAVAAASAAAASAALGKPVRRGAGAAAGLGRVVVGGGGAAARGEAVWSQGTASVVQGVSLLVAAAGIAVIGFHYGKNPTSEYQPILS
jgi:hypothetical protein